MEDIVSKSGHKRSASNPLSVDVPLQVKFNEGLLKRIFSSKDENIKWFLKHNPDFLDKFGLLVIIEITVGNILGTLVNLCKHFYPRKKRAVLLYIAVSVTAPKRNAAIFLQNIFKRWTL